jgi:hypothetical protein
MACKRMMELCSMHDNSHNLSNENLALLYFEMLNYQDLKPIIIDEVGKFITKLMKTNDSLVDVFKVFTPKTTTFYENNQNVHSICSSTDKIALLVIADYGCKYSRPKWRKYNIYFQTLESYDYHSFKLTRLFAAVLNCIKNQPSDIHKELMIRLKQEMSDSIDKCLIGYIVRLLNVFRGYITKYEVDIDSYEQERSKAYLLLNKHINPYSDDIMQQIQTLINNKVIIIPHFLIEILNAYTGESWYMQDNVVKYTKK